MEGMNRVSWLSITTWWCRILYVFTPVSTLHDVKHVGYTRWKTCVLAVECVSITWPNDILRYYRLPGVEREATISCWNQEYSTSVDPATKIGTYRACTSIVLHRTLSPFHFERPSIVYRQRRVAKKNCTLYPFEVWSTDKVWNISFTTTKTSYMFRSIRPMFWSLSYRWRQQFPETERRYDGN